MGALTAVGEVGIWHEGREHLLRPSLRAMASLGSPTEVVELFGLLHGAPPLSGIPTLDGPMVRRWARDQFRTALSVLYACAEDDIGHLVGGISPRMAYQPGVMHPDDVLTLARHLVRHGIIGETPPGTKQGGGGKYSAEFHASEFAALAIAHLGATEREAWDMTMTGLRAAMHAKFPSDGPGSQAPSEAEHDRAMSWLERVNAKRRAANG